MREQSRDEELVAILSVDRQIVLDHEQLSRIVGRYKGPCRSL
jgi:hypothetical protein